MFYHIYKTDLYNQNKTFVNTNRIVNIGILSWSKRDKTLADVKLFETKQLCNALEVIISSYIFIFLFLCIS